MIYNLDGFQFIAPSRRQHKKYDVYLNGKYITSFGDSRYQHFFDKIGYYSNLNHLNNVRRNNYRNRHKNDKLNELSAGYFAFNYLW